jgi:hypothetical protein
VNGDVLRLTIAEQVTPGKRLGRHIVHDPRSRNFPAPGAPTIISVVHNAVGLPLDQGNIGSCTANALCGALNSAPDYAGGPARTEQNAIILYELETKLEGSRIPPTTRAAAASRSARRRTSWDGSRRTSTPSASRAPCSHSCFAR